MSVVEQVITVLQSNSLLLLAALIVLFVVAYRVLQAVINTALVAVLSGLFVVALDLAGMGPGTSVNNIMLFAVLGTAFFILYSALATLIRTSSVLAGLLGNILGTVVKPVKYLFNWLRSDDDESRSKEKEIVLEELRDE